MKPETAFRLRRVWPVLKGIPNCRAFAIQQRGIAGDPDYMLCLHSLFVGLEIKTDIGKLSVIQEVKAKEILAAGGIYIVARPSNWEVVKQVLKEISQKGPCYVHSETKCVDQSVVRIGYSEALEIAAPCPRCLHHQAPGR